MKPSLFFRSVLDWFDPFRYQGATYYTHKRVKVWWWFTWGFYVCLIAFFGFGLSIGMTAITILGSDYGAEATPQFIIGLFASKACELVTCTGPENILGAVGAVGAIAILVSVMFLIFWPGSLRPNQVTDEELTELRMMGYIIFENGKDFDHAINEHRADSDRRSDRAGNLSQPGQLDQAGPADRRANETAEGVGQLAGVNQ